MMRSSLSFLACLFVGRVASHPLCFIDDRPTDPDQVLTFCPEAQDGACCTDLEEAAVSDSVNAAGELSDECFELYKQVVCGVCHSYSAHLYERLGAELGALDGMTMKQDFCDELVEACADEIPGIARTYLGELSYCEKHVGPTGDQFWSYPYEEPPIFEPGLNEVFPDLDSDADFPDATISMRQTPDGSEFWLVGQQGEIKKVDTDQLDEIDTIVDIAENGVFYVAFEEGLLDMAFGPMFGVPGFPDYFYLSYTVQLDDGENPRNRLSKFEYVPGDTTATLGSEEVLITTVPKFNSIHAAGWCGFKPSNYGDGGSSHDLYWTTGDGGPQTDTLNTGQDTTNLLGSMIRISVPSDGTGYEIPSGNLGSLPEVLPEICASGFRNPFRCSFDRETDVLYCGDVGHTDVEEIDIVECGNNYGWSRFEGSRCQEAQEDRDGDCQGASRSGFTFPYFEYCHPDYFSTGDEDEFTGNQDICGDRLITGHAVIGGYVYRGNYFSDVLNGAYIFGDANNRNIYYLNEVEGQLTFGTIVSDASVTIISFSEDINGEIMLLTRNYQIFHMPCGDLCASTCLDQSEDLVEVENMGCFTDSAQDRVLTLSASDCDEGERAMSAQICASYCDTLGARFAGVEFSYECFCGNNEDFDRLGALPASSCEMLCTATSDEFCGGNSAIQVYEITSSERVTNPPTPVDPSYLGCFADPSDNRIMDTSVVLTENSAEICNEVCGDSPFYGTQSGEQCWCGDINTDFAMNGIGLCMTACVGNADEICGGDNAMSVFFNLDVPPPVTTPAPMFVGSPETPEPVGGGTGSPTFVGCFLDTKNERIMTKTATQTPMGSEICQALCPDSLFYGTQFFNECWCGGDRTDFDVHGAATCDAPCAGNTDEICGGSFAMSVYDNNGEGTQDDDAEPTPSPITIITPAPMDVDGSPQFLGCFADVKNDRIMSGPNVASAMSAEICSGICGSTIYGTQYGQECWCGDDDTDYDVHGSATCTFECAGNSDETCGGSNAMSVYSSGGDSPPPPAPVPDVSPVPDTSGPIFIGCFADMKSDRIMTFELTSAFSMTSEACAQLCEGSPFFGTQYAQECWCGSDSDYERHGPATCDFDCTGDPEETCGGRDAMSVYSF